MKRLCAMFFSVSLLCVSCIKDREDGADLNVGDRLPEFTVTMNDGYEIGTERLSDGISCIIFFTTGCPDCRETLPHIQKLYDEFAPKGITFAAISRGDGNAAVAGYWVAEGLTVPFSAQQDRRVYELFAKTRVPRVYINKDGIIKAIFTDIPANPTYEEMKAVIENL